MPPKPAIDRLIHEKLLKSALNYSRAKSILACVFIALIMTPIFSLLYYLLNDYSSATAVLLSGIATIIALFILKKTGSITFAREIIITSVYFALFWLTYNQGGLLSPPSYWFILIPVVATLLGGRRVGIYWGIITAISLIAIYQLQIHISLPISNVSNVLLLQIISICGLLGIILTLVYFFEWGKVAGFQQLEYALNLSQQKSDALVNLAHYDPLTGLPNKIFFESLLREAINRAKGKGKLVVLLYFGLDNFKNVNNSFGHDVGDLVLNEVGKRIKKCVRENDGISRPGSDEFTVILEDIHDINDSAILARKISNIIKAPFYIKGYVINTGSSIGIATFPKYGADAATLIKNANVAMYQAKANGKNNFQYFDENLNNRLLSQLILENELRSASRNNEFYIVYQSQHDSISNEIIAIEALIRWQSPSLGLIKPDMFIQSAEKMGIITSIGEWVIKEACNQFKKWQQAELVLPTTRIAINFSVLQMQQANFLEHIISILNEVNINPNCIELELTESIIMDNPQEALLILQKLTGLGIQIAIDDFGTGYSSLSRLKSFPVHSLKIDKSFLYDLPHNNENASIVQSIIILAHELGLKVVAEGVETIEQLTFLKKNHCDYIQGFYFSRPLNADSMTSLLKKNLTTVN